MINKLSLEDLPRTREILYQLCGIAGLEWHNYLCSDARDKGIYIDKCENPKGCMIVYRGSNVFIKTSSNSMLKEFIEVLDKREEHSFRCLPWIVPMIKAHFKPMKSGEEGVILLTYYVDRAMFKKHITLGYLPEKLSEDSAEEIKTHAREGPDTEFITRRIRANSFYGIFDGGRLISWVGTLWESDDACEVGLAYTQKEYRCKGLGKTLLSIVTGRVLDKGKTPILHTIGGNIPAIKACEAVGYRLGARE